MEEGIDPVLGDAGSEVLIYYKAGINKAVFLCYRGGPLAPTTARILQLDCISTCDISLTPTIVNRHKKRHLLSIIIHLNYTRKKGECQVFIKDL